MNSTKPLSYVIVFGGCFDKDKVSVKVNNVIIVDKYEVISSKMYRGKSNLNISQVKNKIQISQTEKKIYKPGIKLTETIKLDFTVNDKPYHYESNLKNGHIFFVEFCNSQNTRGQTLTFEQRKEPIIIF